MNEDEILRCDYQADLFAALQKRFSCGSAYLIQRFLQSDLARCLDEGVHIIPSIPQAIEEIRQDYPSVESRGGEVYPLEVVEWIGYVTRAYAISTKIPSRQILSRLPVKTFMDTYDAFHTLSVTNAVERLREIALENHPVRSDYEIAKSVLGPKYKRLLRKSR